MNHYYQDERCTIYHGDCREVLPELDRFNCTVTSPPYNMIPATKPSGFWAKHKNKSNDGYLCHNDAMAWEEYVAFVVDVIGQCLACTDGIVWVNHKTKHIDGEAMHPARIYPFRLFAELIWDCCGSRTLNANRYAPSHEHILGFGERKFWDRVHDTKCTVWRINSERENAHPAPFPISIPQRLIASSCPPSGCVLDPFMGSGTTLFAAKLEGRQGVGIEINERYCEMAANRLSQGVLF